MRKIKNNNPLKILGFTVIFAILSIAVYAQDNARTPSGSTQNQPPSTQYQSDSTQVQSTQGQATTSQDLTFNNDAQRFANELAQQTGLSSDKADKIRQILVDYHNNIIEVRQDFARGRQVAGRDNAGSVGLSDSSTTNRDNSNNNPNVTGGQSGNNAGNEVGSNRGTDQTSTTTAVGQDLLSEYRKADVKADKDILDVFDNDSQKAKYVQIKRQWWQDVKNRVFSAENQSVGGQQTR